MKIVKATGGGKPTEQRGVTFTGTVWADVVLPETDGNTVGNVFFTPSARTYWHSHERGQLLHVRSGRGLVCPAGETPQPISEGDTIWAAPGERHWHGGGPDTSVLHTAVSLGPTTWLEEVTDEEYLSGGAVGAAIDAGDSNE
jgi:quercetin dioxygenase-like cupin family protein